MAARATGAWPGNVVVTRTASGPVAATASLSDSKRMSLDAGTSAAS